MALPLLQPFHQLASHGGWELFSILLMHRNAWSLPSVSPITCLLSHIIVYNYQNISIPIHAPINLVVPYVLAGYT